MTLQSPTPIDNLDLLPQRQLTIASLVPALLWRRLSLDNTDTLDTGDFQSLDAVVVQMRLYGPSSTAVLDELSNNVPSVIAVAYNTLYAYLVSALNQAGGLLTEMSMHHLTAVFPVEGGTKAAQVFQALIGIETAINTSRGKTPPGYPNIHWFVSAGVSYGKVNTAILGNDFLGRKLMLLGGPAKIQAEDALEFTRRGQLVVHRTVLKQLATAPDGEWLSDQFFLARDSYKDSNLAEMLDSSKAKLPSTSAGTPPSTLLQAHRLAAFLDPRIRTRAPFLPFQQGRYTQHLTVLTLRLIGMGLPDRLAVEQWQDVLEQVFDISARFGGMIDSVVTELGLGEIRIVFGVPEEQEYVERRAARCALALNRTLSTVDPLLRIGIASSKGFAALLGTRFFSSYVAISPAIDVSKQLVERAEAREILCDDSVYSATSSLFAWREQPSRLGGQGAIYALAGEVSLGSGLSIRHEVTKHLPIVGRYAEREALSDHVQRAIKGEGHLILITGQSGNGRSTLIDSVIEDWLNQNGNGFVSLGPTYTPSSPYSLWLPIWRAIFDLSLDEAPKEKYTKLARAFSRILPDADGGVGLFANLLGLDEKEDPGLKYLPPNLRERRLFDATLTMLNQLADISPILLVFEHTEFSDDPSLVLLNKLMASLKNKPILICVEDRRNPSHSLAKNFPKTAVIDVKPLTSAESWQLVEKRLPNVSWPYSYKRALEERIGVMDKSTERRFTPAMVTALVTALEHDFVTKTKSGMTANAKYSAQDIPQDETESIGWLITHVLNESERQIITRAAASGIQFPHHADWLLDGTTGTRSTAVEIERLEELGFVQRYLDNGSGERWSRFRHESIREIFYSQLDFSTRSELHQAVIRWYQRHMPGAASMNIVAAHAERAGLSNLAVEAYLKAAAFAVEWGAISEALQSLLAAERHLAHSQATSELMLDLCLTRANLHLMLNQPTQGLDQANLAYAYAEDLNNKIGKARSLLFQARFAQLDNDHEKMLASASRALSLAQESNHPQTITEATWLRAKAMMALGKRREAVRLLLNALDRGTLHDGELELEMRLDVARILLVDHYRERANEHVIKLYEQSSQIDNPVLLHQISSLHGHVQLLYGAVHPALESLERALTLPPPPNAGMSPLAEVLLNHGIALCYAGRYMDAGAIFEAAEDYYLSDNISIQAHYVDLMRAFELYLDQRNWEAIETTLRKIDLEKDMSGVVSINQEEIPFLVNLLQLALYINNKDFENADSLAQSLVDQTDSPTKRWYAPMIYIAIARLRLAQYRPEIATELAYKALGAVSTQGDLRYLSPSYTLLAESLIMRDDSSIEAINDALSRAIKSGRDHGRRLDLARALLVMGQFLHATSHRHRTRALGSSHLFEAEQIFREIGIAQPTDTPHFRKPKLNDTTETKSVTQS